MKQLIVIVAVVLATASCKKKETVPLPSGKNTFSCQIAGKAFTPHLDPILLTSRQPLRAYRTGTQGGFVLQAQDALNVLEIYLAATQGSGTYPVGYVRGPIPYAPNPDSYAGYTQYRGPQSGDDPYNPPAPTRYYTDGSNTGTVTFTRLDTVARIAGGTFEYTAREMTTGQTVRIKNGTFDVKF
ncbi:hypothetical protein [Hymenobacter amundsenii]|nr:hypothetical protein [Hymenobacter amundsenii]